MTASSTLAVASGSSKSIFCLVRCVLFTDLHDPCSIVVAELTQDDEHTSEESLAASSVIMPPAPSLGAATVASTGISNAASSITIPSVPHSDDGTDNSFDSSISLVNIPSSPFLDDDDDLYQDSRSQVASNIQSPAAIERDLEYVVLYDTSSNSSAAE